MSQEDVCAICYSTISIPISVPVCGHRFCFCCLKGACVDRQDPLCPMCRRSIDPSIFDHPSMAGLSLTLVAEPDTDISLPEKSGMMEVRNGEGQSTSSKSTDNDKKQYWLYAGSNGWWRYEPRDEGDINKAYEEGRSVVELTMCGHAYIVDFGKMEQLRKNNQKIKRKIKHVTEEELRNLNVRGIAGMRCS